MSNLLKKKDVVPYGIASNNLNNDVCLLPQNLLNWHDNDFAKDPVPIEQHLCLTCGSDSFTSSVSKPGYHLPQDGEEGKCTGSRHLLVHRLWQFISTVGLRAMQYNFNIHNSDKQVGEEEEEETDDMEDDLCETHGPPICYQLENGQYVHDHENSLFGNNFNNKSQEQQEVILSNNADIRVVSKEEYDAEISAWPGGSDSNSSMETKQPFVILIEFLRGKNEKTKCTGYRIWILKKKGGHGDLNQIVTEVIEAANKPVAKDRGNKLPENNWRKINTINAWAEAVGSTLYKDGKKFLQDCRKYHLNDERSSCKPTNILSAGHWRSVLCGTQDDTKNSLPQLYCDLDPDEERFKETNYFTKDFDFCVNEKFRESMYVCQLRDLQNFMQKCRLDEFVDHLWPMLQQLIPKMPKHRNKNAVRMDSENMYLAGDGDKRFERFPIHVDEWSNFQGVNVGTSHMEADGSAAEDFIHKPGEGDNFLFLRALTLRTTEKFRKMYKQTTDCKSKRDIRLAALKNTLSLATPLFRGSGSKNISPGLNGIITMRKKLLQSSGFSKIFLPFNPLQRRFSFQDDFLAFLFNGFEYCLFVTHLQTELYAAFIFAGSAYTLKKQKTHVNYEGPPGTGKSAVLLDNMKDIKCDGVCRSVTSTSLKAHLYGDHKTFEICLRHEPNRLHSAGGKKKADVYAQQSLEMEKTMLSEQKGRVETSVFDKENSRYTTQVKQTILSVAVFQCQNFSTKGNAKALQDRFLRRTVNYKFRDVKDVNYMQTAMNQMTSAQENKRENFLNTCKYIDSEFGIVNAINDLVGTLSEPNMDAFNDVMEHIKKKPEYSKSNRNTDRCKNTAKTQIVYDSLMVLNSLPSQKTLHFYVDGQLLPSEDDVEEDDEFRIPTQEALREKYDDIEECILRKEYRCNIFRSNDGISFVKTGEPLEARFDLINNKVFTIDKDGDETFEGDIERKWEYDKLWKSEKVYEKGDICYFHFTGEIANYSSFYEIREYTLSTRDFYFDLNTREVLDGVTGKGLGLHHFDYCDVNVKFISEARLIQDYLYQHKVTNVRHLPYEVCKTILIRCLNAKEHDVERKDPRHNMNKLTEIHEERQMHVDIVNQIWKLKKNDIGQTQTKESLLGKYRDEPVAVDTTERAIEMWRDLDLLQYCTVDIAVRTFALMRDDFAPQVIEKLRIAIANIAVERITTGKGFIPSQATKHYLPKGEIQTAYSDVDFDYIHVGTRYQLTQLLRDILKKQMQKGMEVEVSEIDVQDLLVEMDKETAERRYTDPKKPVVIHNDQWCEFQGMDTYVPWERNHERQTNPIRVKVLEKAKQGDIRSMATDLYVNLAWVSDMIHSTGGAYVEDLFIKHLSTYKYPSDKKETKSILIGSAWTGILKDKNNEDVLSCQPAVSSCIKIESSPGLRKPIKILNKQTDYAFFSSMGCHPPPSKRRKAQKDEFVTINYDRYIACKHAKLLNEHDEPLNEALSKKMAYLSKHDLLLERNENEKQLFFAENLDCDFTDVAAQQAYDTAYEINRQSSNQTEDCSSTVNLNLDGDATL